MVKTVKKLRATKAIQRTPRRPKFADERYLGPEPEDNVTIDSDADIRFIDALKWYNYFYEYEDSRKWLHTYLEGVNTPSDVVKAINAAPIHKVSRTSGTIARLLTKGWVLTPGIMERFEARLNEVVSYSKSLAAQTRRAPGQSSIQDKTQSRARLLAYGNLDDIIDGYLDSGIVEGNPVYDMLVKEKASPQACKMMQDKVSAIVSDYSDTEAFKNISKRQIQSNLKFYKSILEDIQRFQQNKRTVKPRKPRQPKPKNTAALVAKAKYCKEFAPLKLVSVPPVEIIKSQTVWVYNTKYKQVSVYHATDKEGLSIKGTTLQNYNEATAVTKRLRKPDDTIQHILASSKIALRNYMQTIKTSPSKAKGRLNEDTVILRVIK